MRFQEHQLTEYRRHAPDCKLKKASDLNCNCPLWVQGRIHGKLIRRSLNTRSRQRARDIIRTLLDQRADAPPVEPAKAPPTIPAAIADYLRFCERNKRLKGRTLVSYRATFKVFQSFCVEHLFTRVDQLNLRLFEKYLVARDGKTPKTIEKEFKHLVGFCARGMELGWLAVNFAAKVTLPKTDGVSTLPFKESEVEALIAACSHLGDEQRRYTRALVLLLLSTGLRIHDAVTLARAKVYVDRSGATRLRLRTEKTGVVVTLKLPNATVEALKNLRATGGEFYFWKGGDERALARACDYARRLIGRLGRIAAVADAHPHRFRDTWAKTALLNGTPMRTVQLVLGHKSIRTTEEHYAPYVPEYQEMIDAATDAVAERLIA